MKNFTCLTVWSEKAFFQGTDETCFSSITGTGATSSSFLNIFEGYNDFKNSNSDSCLFSDVKCSIKINKNNVSKSCL